MVQVMCIRSVEGSFFWQYKLGLFSPKGLNERVADVELDLFAFGGA